MRAAMVAVLAMMALVNVAVAQSDTTTITVTVERHECPPTSTTVTLAHGFEQTFTVPFGETTATAGMSIYARVYNAGCYQWTLNADIGDFKLTTDESVTFRGSTLSLVKKNVASNPEQGLPQIPWITNLPDGLAMGDATMPGGTVTFSSANDTAPYTGSEPLMKASTEEYGSPGSWYSYYDGFLANVPAGQQPGTYTAVLTLTLQGAD